MDGELRVSCSLQDMDWNFLFQEIPNFYWAQGRSRQMIERSVRQSLSFALLLHERQIGFARVITDGVTFAYLCDVFVQENHRGRGYGKRLLTEVMNHRELRSVKWTLRTRDAHTLYEKIGFRRSERADRYMERKEGYL